MATKAQSEQSAKKPDSASEHGSTKVKKVKQTDPKVRELLDGICEAHKELGSRGMAPLKKLLVEQGVISEASLSQILSGTFVSKSNIPHAKEILKRIKTLTAEKAKAFKNALSTPSSKLPKVEEKKRGKPAAKVKVEKVAKAKTVKTKTAKPVKAEKTEIATPSLKNLKNKVASETPVAGTKVDLANLKRREKSEVETFEISNPTTLITEQATSNTFVEPEQQQTA